MTSRTSYQHLIPSFRRTTVNSSDGKTPSK